MKRFLYLTGILLILTACKEVYEAPPQALLQAKLYNSVSKKSESVIVTVQGKGIDSLLVYEKTQAELLLPLRNKDTTNFVVWFDSKSDSISFRYQTLLKYASMETGFYYEYKLRSVRFTHNRIDSLKIIDSLVTTKWNENIKIYLHPLPAGSK